MSIGGRAALRRRYLRRVAVLAGVLVLLALLLLSSGHWVLGLLFGAAAAVAILVFVQMRTVH
jgi:hypothetical protein